MGDRRVILANDRVHTYARIDKIIAVGALLLDCELFESCLVGHEEQPDSGRWRWKGRLRKIRPCAIGNAAPGNPEIALDIRRCLRVATRVSLTDMGMKGAGDS